MKPAAYSIAIKAPINLVYRTMLGLDNVHTYEQWTAIFNPTSTFEGDWQVDSKMLFIGTDDKGHRGGMVSTIVAHIANEVVSIKHLGIVEGDKEITTGEQVTSWAGGLESYFFKQIEATTTVTVKMDTIPDYVDYFNTTYPKALEKLKEIVENGN